MVIARPEKGVDPLLRFRQGDLVRIGKVLGQDTVSKVKLYNFNLCIIAQIGAGIGTVLGNEHHFAGLYIYMGLPVGVKGVPHHTPDGVHKAVLGPTLPVGVFVILWPGNI